MPKYKARDNYGCTELIEAENMEDAIESAREWCEGGSWGQDKCTAWVSIRVVELDDEGDDTDNDESIQVTMHPDEPPCPGMDGHEWTGYRVHSHGGGIISTETCKLCGLKRTRDSWAQDPETGEQGLDSIKYEQRDN